MGVVGSDGRCVLTAAAAAKPTIGEYGRTFGVGAGVKDETWRSMTNSCVAFVSVTIFVRSVDDSWLGLCACLLRGWWPFSFAAAATTVAAGVGAEPLVVTAPRVLRAFDSWMTV